MTHSIFVIILNWNRKADTIECLKSLEKVSTLHQIVVVDNGSTDDSVQAFKKLFPKITILETGKNLGYAEGNNVGVRYSLEEGATHLLILNNDTIVDPQILEGFLTYPDAPILGAKPYLYSDPARLDHLGGMWNSKRLEFDLIGLREDGSKWTKLEPLDYVCGCALFAKAEVFHEVGGFEPRFFLFWEESDWCFRAKRQGFASYFCPEAKLWHKVSASFTGGKPHTTYFWWRNRLFWLERNCSKSERLKLIPEVLHLFKRYPLKKVQLFLLKKFRPEEDLTIRKQKLLVSQAALTGIKDYLLRRFGSGPF